MTINQLMGFLICIACMVNMGVSIFCSVMCQTNFCNTNTHNDCTACRSPFSDIGGGVCGMPASAVIDEVETSSDISGSLSCDASLIACGDLNIFGRADSSSTITFTSAGISDPHYKFRIVFQIVMINDWDAVGETMNVTVGEQTY